MEKLGAAILENGPIDKKSKTLVEAQGPPMPVLRRLHLSTWRHGGDVFPRMDFDALAPIGFGDGRKAIVVGEGTLYATRRVRTLSRNPMTSAVIFLLWSERKWRGKNRSRSLVLMSNKVIAADTSKKASQSYRGGHSKDARAQVWSFNSVLVPA